MPENEFGFMQAREDFRRARQQASLQEVVGRLRGKSQDLLSYEEVLRRVHAVGAGIQRGLQEIPLDSIVGSTGRYTDFTRTFLPRNSSDEERWARVMLMVSDPSGSGLDPVELIKVGDVYFVRDGHHRISVARQLGSTSIHAYVTEVPTRVPLTPDMEPEDLLLMEEYTGFLEATGLDRSRPDSAFDITAPGGYERLLEHIQVHQYFMGQSANRDIPLQDAAGDWYDEVYLPAVEAIRAQGILEDFPGRSEADLYLWVMEHRTHLQQGFGDFVSIESAANHLAQNYGTRTGRVAARIGKTLTDAVLPESGPRAGTWREEKETREAERLFEVVLVPINGGDEGWSALEQAFRVARHEGSKIHGLHILRDEADRASDAVTALRTEFSRRCEEAGLPGGLAVESGDVTRRITERAPLTDLVVLTLAHPPSNQPLQRLGSGFRRLIQSCPRPILAVPCGPTDLQRAILAYDGSPKAREALYVAAYLANSWGTELTVVAVEESGVDAEDMLEEADEYLHSRSVQASGILRSGRVAKVVLQAAAETDCQLLILGGYGSNPMMEVVLGSQVDEVLRESCIPILVCR